MLACISPYSEKVTLGALGGGRTTGYRSVWLHDSFWISGQAKLWLGDTDDYECGNGSVVYVEVLPPRPNTYQKPVYLCEARFDAFKGCRTFGNGELVRVLPWFRSGDLIDFRTRPIDHLFLLAEEKIAVVHWLPVYQLWQLHVTNDWPYQVSPGTRIFALT
jgi:hypothetical protein